MGCMGLLRSLQHWLAMGLSFPGAHFSSQGLKRQVLGALPSIWLCRSEVRTELAFSCCPTHSPLLGFLSWGFVAILYLESKPFVSALQCPTGHQRTQGMFVQPPRIPHSCQVPSNPYLPPLSTPGSDRENSLPRGTQAEQPGRPGLQPQAGLQPPGH